MMMLHDKYVNMQQRDAAYQSCPCPMPLRPKNIYTVRLTGDVKGSRVATKQAPGTSFHQRPLPPVALALPPEPPGTLGRTSCNQEEVAIHQSGWKLETQSKLEANKQEQLGQNGTAAVGKTDTSRLWLLAISRVASKRDAPVCRTKAQYLSEVTLAKPEAVTVVDPKMVCNGVKTEMRNLEDVLTESNKSPGLTQNGSKAIFRNGSSWKRKAEPAKSSTRAETDLSVPKRHKLSSLERNNGTLSISNEESRKTKNAMNEPCDQVNGLPPETRTKSRNWKKSQHLCCSICSLNSVKHNVRKHKLHDAKDLTENKEPVTIPLKKKGEAKVRRVQTKLCPSRVKQTKKVTHHEAIKGIHEALDSVVTRGPKIVELLATIKRNIGSNVSLVTKKMSANKSVERTKSETKISRIISHQKKPRSRHQGGKQQQHLQQDLIVAALCRKAAPKKPLQAPKWLNGWKFEGDPFESKVFISGNELKPRKCYPLMRHEEGDVICPRDCILLKSGPRKMDLPFVAKVAALWENPDDGGMMVSLLWYYHPGQTKHGRRPEDAEHEIFASKHKDISNVNCIEAKCYVLTFNEYCRYHKYVRGVEEGVREPGLELSRQGEYPRKKRQPPGMIDPNLVFFCRRVYSFKQHRVLNNPS